MKKTVLMIFVLFAFNRAFSQTEAALKAQLNAKKDSISAIEKRANAIQAKINALPGWKTGAFGTIGGSFSRFNNWYTQAIPNNTAGNIGFTFNTFANLKQEKFFWRNNASVNLGWIKLDNRDVDTDSDDFEITTDVFQITSLFGWKLSERIAISALAEYRTTLIENLNDPGYLDIGLGATWTPIEDLVVVVHPLNYNFVFSDQDNIYGSSMGAKIVVDYTRKIGEVSFKTNLSSFTSYESNDLNNYTWTNGFSYTIWKSLGVGFDFALRNNKQEALDYSVNTLGNEDETFESLDNELQSFWILGVSYSF